MNTQILTCTDLECHEGLPFLEKLSGRDTVLHFPCPQPLYRTQEQGCVGLMGAMQGHWGRLVWPAPIL